MNVQQKIPGVPELFVTNMEGSINHLVTQGMAPGTAKELRTARWDGSDDNNVTVNLPSYSNVEDFAWSPDGNNIAYMADINSPGAMDPFVSTADGSMKNHISGFMNNDEGSVSRFLWSPDSAYIALTADATLLTYDELFVSTPNGDIMQISDPQLPLLPDQGEVYDNFQWSPDGSYLGYLTIYGHSSTIIDKLLIFTPASGGSQVLVRAPIVPGSFRLE